MDDPRGVSRRALLLSAGVGLGAVTGDGARKPLLAQADRPRADERWSAEYVARKGDVSLALYRKRIGPPQAGDRPVLFLVPASSISANPSFDPAVAGRRKF